ncbi:hypothetical protein KM043_003851 [Ampulex compressa]|nr:hypothetical protein KM043_003851 [Ampulex compressa]
MATRRNRPSGLVKGHFVLGESAETANCRRFPAWLVAGSSPTGDRRVHIHRDRIGKLASERNCRYSSAFTGVHAAKSDLDVVKIFRVANALSNYKDVALHICGLRNDISLEDHYGATPMLLSRSIWTLAPESSGFVTVFPMGQIGESRQRAWRGSAKARLVGPTGNRQAVVIKCDCATLKAAPKDTYYDTAACSRFYGTPRHVLKRPRIIPAATTPKGGSESAAKVPGEPSKRDFGSISARHLGPTTIMDIAWKFDRIRAVHRRVAGTHHAPQDERFEEPKVRDAIGANTIVHGLDIASLGVASV